MFLGTPGLRFKKSHSVTGRGLGQGLKSDYLTKPFHKKKRKIPSEFQIQKINTNPDFMESGVSSNLAGATITTSQGTQDLNIGSGVFSQRLQKAKKRRGLWETGT